MTDKLSEIKLEATKFIAERLAAEGFVNAGKLKADASDFLPFICITVSAGIYRPEHMTEDQLSGNLQAIGGLGSK